MLPMQLACLLSSLLPLVEELEPVVRDLDLLELFGGEQMITREARKASLEARAFDKRYAKDGSQDLLLQQGFRTALAKVLRVKEHGTVWGAPWCGPWTFINRSGTGRSRNNPAGDPTVERVAYSNKLTTLLVMLFLVAWARSVNIIMEQPCSSLMRFYSPMKEFLETCMTFSQSTYLGAFGAPSVKPIMLFGSSDGIKALARSRPTGLLKLTRKENGRVNGDATALRASQAYPRGFGTAVAKVINTHFKTKPKTDRFKP